MPQPQGASGAIVAHRAGASGRVSRSLQSSLLDGPSSSRSSLTTASGRPESPCVSTVANWAGPGPAVWGHSASLG